MKLKISLIVVALLSINFSSCADTGRLTKSSPPIISPAVGFFSSVQSFFEKTTSNPKMSQSTPLLPDMTTRRLSNTHLNDSQEYNPEKDNTDDTQSEEEKTNTSSIPSLPMATNNYPKTPPCTNAQDVKAKIVVAFKQLGTTGSASELSTVLQLAKRLPESEQEEVRKLYKGLFVDHNNRIRWQKKVSLELGIDYIPQS